MILPPLPTPAIHAPFLKEVRTVHQGDYYTAEQMQAHYRKGRADALLDAMNATTPFGKTGAVIAAAIGALK